MVEIKFFNMHKYVNMLMSECCVLLEIKNELLCYNNIL